MPHLAEQTTSLTRQSESASHVPVVKSKYLLVRGAQKVTDHFRYHVGVGIMCAIAYFDPGNWSVDLQAGSQYGYRPLLFVVLLAGFGAVVLQSLSYKLGCVTGLDLATHCRVLLHDRPKHRRLIRWTVLYPLYVLCEVAIISTDLAELLGSATGLCLLFPALPLWTGVLLTALDVLIFLIVGDPSRSSRPVKTFELVMISMVFAVFASFVVLLVRVKPDWSDVFMGYIPSARLFDVRTEVLYTAVGILGATVMPHALFLGSFLATQDRTGSYTTDLPVPVQFVAERSLQGRLRTWLKSLFSVTRSERVAAARDYRHKYGRENREIGFIRAHLSHGLTDIVTSLLGIAVPINSAILILSAAVFYRAGTSTMTPPAGLFDAHDLIAQHVSSASATVFAVALLCAGQTSSITATLSGQIVAEGFLEWRLSPFLRRLFTRSISLVPAMVVAIAVGRPGLSTLLVASQVALSVVLPFISLPLILLTSSKSIMRVRVPRAMEAEKSREQVPLDSLDATEDGTDGRGNNTAIREVSRDETLSEKNDGGDIRTEIIPVQEDEYIDFSNGPILTTVAGLVFLVILAANIYVFVVLGQNSV